MGLYMEKLNKEDMYISVYSGDAFVKWECDKELDIVGYFEKMTDKINEIVDYINRENESVDYAPLPPNLEEKNGIMGIIDSL